MIYYYLSVLAEKILLRIGYIFKDYLKIRSDDAPIFIVSAGRSGSTLLRKLLIQTGYFNIPPESGDFLPSAAKIYIRNMFMSWTTKKKKILGLINNTKELKIWDVDVNSIKGIYEAIPDMERNLGIMIKSVYIQYAKDKMIPDTQFWGDKTPYLVYRLPWVKLMYPKAKIIHIVRDPRAVVLSRQREFGDSIEYAIKRWKWSIKCISKAKKSQDIMEVKFEDLILSTDQTMNKILSFIGEGLTYEKKNTSVILSDNHFQHHKNLNKPIQRNKITEWKNYLSTDDKEYIEQMLSFDMRYYGYNI
jgi:hypothetical protein